MGRNFKDTRPLALLCQTLGIHLKELKKIFDCHVNTLQRIASGKAKPSVELARQIAHRYGLSEDWLRKNESGTVIIGADGKPLTKAELDRQVARNAGSGYGDGTRATKFVLQAQESKHTVGIAGDPIPFETFKRMSTEQRQSGLRLVDKLEVSHVNRETNTTQGVTYDKVMGANVVRELNQMQAEGERREQFAGVFELFACLLIDVYKDLTHQNKLNLLEREIRKLASRAGIPENRRLEISEIKKLRLYLTTLQQNRSGRYRANSDWNMSEEDLERKVLEKRQNRSKRSRNNGNSR